ncbi:MAG: HAMP domain-containing sensor histidine kinase [Candidatus Nitrosopolaris sp.]
MTNEINKTNPGRIEVIHDSDTIIDIYVHILHNARSRWDYFADVRSLSVVPLAFEAIKKTLLEAKARATRLRFITEITKENISYAKDFMEIVELRHLDGVKGNFGISDSEYIAISTTDASLSEKITTIPHAVYSNVIEDIQQQQYVFEILWNKATPAEQRIKEIEEGIERVETVAIKNITEIAKRINKNIESSNEIKIASHPGGLELIYNNFLESYKKVLNRYRKGEHKGIRFVTTINKDNEGLATLLLNEGVQLRHTKNLTPLSFSISNKEFHATAEKMEGGKMISSLLVSTEPLYIDHYNFIFEQLWDNSIDAIDRINDIKEGVDLADIEVIPRSARTRLLYLELVKSAKEEILFIFPTSSAFIRQEKVGAIPLAVQAAKERAVKVRILVPYNEEVENRLNLRVEEELGGRPIYDADIDFKYTEQTSGTMATILVVDRKASLVMEIRDDSKTIFDEAIGLSTYSNSKAGVLSYVGIFEKLWNQIELYQQVKEANERLKLHDKMQQEFINVAAHELRTPIQPILSTVGLLSSANQAVITREELNDSLSMITRNAIRLKQLSEDILDVTKIESQSLNLRKEVCDLNEIVRNSIEEYKRNQVIRSNTNTEIKYTFYVDKVFVEVDRSRIAQVISNLLSNAFKFTKEGSIIVNVELDQRNSRATVSVKDSGKGIDPEVVPRLFEKFASKSFQGTGLGLFISRSIVEGHGGRIWTVNNNKVVDGQRGVTFYFTLPLVRSQPDRHNLGKG